MREIFRRTRPPRGVAGDDPDRRAALLAAWGWSSMLVVAVAAVLLAQSRGGMLALSVALVVTSI